jgi:hypothetical protein
MTKSKHAIALVLALSMLFYALPKLSVSGEWSPSSLFAWLWLAFAYLVIAANWRAVLEVDREQKVQQEYARRLRWLEVQKQSRYGSWRTGERRRIFGARR